jgi:carboxyl-terminal processing protease
MALVASLGDGHTWFYDKWFDENYGQPVAFFAFPAGDKWAVRRSDLDAVKIGDVITAVDGVPIQEFFAARWKYLSSSSIRDAELSLFMTPAVFPLKFSVTFADGRKLMVDRVHDQRHETPALKTEGRWIEPGTIAYIKLPGLHGYRLVTDALDFVRQFQEAKTIILDVRGNEGGGNGRALQDALMDRPYTLWTEHSNVQGGALLRAFQGHHPPSSVELSIAKGMGDPERSDIHFKGRVLLLTDRECTCACEDFVMPFKITHRAQLIGETTAGTFSHTHFTEFENGMMLNVSAIRNTFPDGSKFEGIGISPDVEVGITPEDLKAGRDPVLEKAVQYASGSPAPQGTVWIAAQRNDTDPSWSPDGHKIVFTSDRGSGADIYVMNADGTGERRLTNDQPGQGAPFWSPDGSTIAFTKRSKDAGEIWVMKSDGSSPKRISPRER